VWINGKLLPSDEAFVSPFDHGFTVGDGVFETLKVVDGVPFALTRHLRRLRRSADVLGIVIDRSDDELRAGLAELVTAAGNDAGRVRITVTAGPGPLGSDRDDVPPTVVLAASAIPPWPPVTEVVTVAWVRNERSPVSGAKTTSYAENVRALMAAHELGATEALFANTVGRLCEGTGSNVFLVRDGKLLTPSLASGCLAGITRELVLELGHGTEVDDLTMGDLVAADEAFLTSSTRDVHPISVIDAVPLAAVPGPFTKAAAHALAELRSRTLDP
jgi:branched-chain amino acid aminotransferase